MNTEDINKLPDRMCSMVELANLLIHLEETLREQQEQLEILLSSLKESKKTLNNTKK